MIRSEGGLKTTSNTLSLSINKDDNLLEIQCIVVHDTMKAKLELKLTLNVLYPPEVKTCIVIENILSEGESVTVTCDVESNPPASITWTKQELRKRFVSSGECHVENSLDLSNPSTQILDVQCK